MKDLKDLRVQYSKGSLDRSELPENPFDLFNSWLNAARLSDVVEPNAMTLSTSAGDIPSARTVLIKELTDTGIVFYTNYESQKAQDIDINPVVALNFLWKEMERQVRLRGTAEKISAERSLAYFQSRPRDSQISAWTSPQSQMVMNKDYLMELRDKVEMRFADEEHLPLPPDWGGIEIKLHYFEFWQGRPNRFHDRFVYELIEDTWQIQRLAP